MNNKCEYCGNEHDGSFATGRFCNIKCSNGFSTKSKRKEINKKVSNTLTGKYTIYEEIERKCIICKTNFKIKSNCTKKTCSDKCKNKLISNKLKIILPGKCGGYRKGAGRTKGDYYKEQYFDSPFEIEVAKFLDKHNIKWKRNTKRFYFIWNNKKTYYIPDFLINENLYLETKGYWFGDKKEKTIYGVKQNNLNWILLMQKQEWNINKNILLEKINGAEDDIGRVTSLSS